MSAELANKVNFLCQQIKKTTKKDYLFAKFSFDTIEPPAEPPAESPAKLFDDPSGGLLRSPEEIDNITIKPK